MEPFRIEFSSPRFLSELYCSSVKNIHKVEDALDVKIVTRENWLEVQGSDESVDQVRGLFEHLSKIKSQGIRINPSDFNFILNAFANKEEASLKQLTKDPLVLSFKKCSIVPKTLNQKLYLNGIEGHDLVIGVGPAGTGKTFLAVAKALEGLFAKRFKKIILTRPAVEAGETLGYLPGDLEEKILPYLRPLYDAMDLLIGPQEAGRLLETGVIEIAPLAYMRGRTLVNSCIILDEGQNATMEQMRMFLTRLGENSKMVVNGDITQIDLPKSRNSGLVDAIKVLENIDDIKIFYFNEKDAVRHPLVQKIIHAYKD